MSHSSGAVRFEDGLILYFEYNGTIDVCQPKLFDTRKELKANWRTKDWPYCGDTNHRHEKVEIASTYGYGFHWIGDACRTCKILISPLEVDYDTKVAGLPDWYPNKEEVEKMYHSK